MKSMFALLCLQRRHPCSATTVGSHLVPKPGLISKPRWMPRKSRRGRGNTVQKQQRGSAGCEQTDQSSSVSAVSVTNLDVADDKGTVAGAGAGRYAPCPPNLIRI